MRLSYLPLLGLLYGCNSQQTSWPPFTIYNLDGTETSLAEIGSKKDEPLVLNIWTFFCRPCLEEIPVLEDMNESSVRILGVQRTFLDNMNEVDYAYNPEMWQFLEGIRFRNTLALNEDYEQFNETYVESDFTFPVSLLYDSNGEFQIEVVGTMEDPMNLDQIISELEYID